MEWIVRRASASTRRSTARIGAVLIALAVLATACTGGTSDGGSNVATPTASTGPQITPVLIDSELVVGENRFTVGLLNEENEGVADAQVALRFFKLHGEQQELRGEAQATPITLEKSYTHTHEDGTVETHSAGESGVYVATVRFDEAGQWRAEVTASVGETAYDPVSLALTVVEEGASVPVGAPAPRSETLTIDDVDDIAEIDTSSTPIPEMHTMTIAEAVTSGRPSVIVFATPAFCLSRFCGPTKEIVDQLFGEYRDEANFVHVEPYEVDRARNGEGLFPVAAMIEWGLRSEPWVFLVDSKGNIAAKFEAVVTLAELKQALEPLLRD